LDEGLRDSDEHAFIHTRNFTARPQTQGPMKNGPQGSRFKGLDNLKN
jgi:hypothetical protein